MNILQNSFIKQVLHSLEKEQKPEKFFLDHLLP